MMPLDPIPVEHRLLYLRCAGQTQNLEERQTLLNMTERVCQSGIEYVNALSIGRADLVARMAMNPNERVEIAKMYAARLVSNSGIERATYDAIRSLAATCPFCGFGEVYEVDHYLPQIEFPELNILPVNLLPICHPCNHTKDRRFPEGQEQSFIHPYFDRLPDERWLFAKLAHEMGGPVLNFSVALPEARGPIALRLKYHFDSLRLPKRMREQSARILVEMQSDIDDYLADIGAEKMRSHFLHGAQRDFERYGNTMEVAAYYAAADDELYCAGMYTS